MNKCKFCGANSEGEFCFKHKKRTPLSKGTRKKKTEGMQDFFMHIWNTRIHKSEISGEHLGKEALSVFFHHILPKNKYEDAQFDEDNIILLTFEEHDTVESDMYKYEEINVRREKLKIKYNW